MSDSPLFSVKHLAISVVRVGVNCVVPVSNFLLPPPSSFFPCLSVQAIQSISSTHPHTVLLCFVH